MDIKEIEIQADDMGETETFYADILGLQLVSKEQNSISFLAGHSTLTFIKSNNLHPKYHFAFNIPHNKLDEAIIWAKSRFTFIKNTEDEIVSYFESWNARAIYFYDNNKNILEFIARFDVDNSIDKPFDISCIQSISEIGIVADQPLKLSDKLIEENNLSLFEKGIRSEDFITLGNDSGLFIIVTTNRKWYPTGQQAEKHYTRIKIATSGITREITFNVETES